MRRQPYQGDAKALKPFDEYDGKSIEVLGVPFGGHIEGRDSDGEAFHAKTDIAMNIGDSVTATYYHGFGPDDNFSFQDPPQFIGRAKYIRRDERGHWFEVKLDNSDDLAARVITALDNGEDVKASSGAVGHLVRTGGAGLIDVWPVGELAVFDTNETRQPANQLAIVNYMKSTEQPEAALRAYELENVASVEADDIEVKSKTETNTEVKPMSDEKNTQETQPEIQVVTPEIDYGAIASETAKAMLPTIQEAVKSQVVDAVANLDIDGKVKAAVSEIADQPAKEEPAIAAPNVKKVTKAGFSNEDSDAFLYYLKTGKEVKAALQEGTDAEGGYLVPNDFYGPIVEKRNEMSIARQVGVDVFQTSRQVVDIPTENAAATDFVLTAEEAAYNQNEPTFANEQVTVYKYTKEIRISEELLTDEASNLMQFLSNTVGRAAASTENAIFAVGTGSGQPEGLTVGGSNGVTAAGAAAITAGEVIDLYTSLGDYIQNNAFWMMAKETYSAIRQLQGNGFLFQPTPQGNNAGPDLNNHNVYLTHSMPAMTTGLKSVVFANPSFYTLVENGSMTMQRNDMLYMATGQVALFFKFRVGGIVTQSDGVKFLTQA